jgi:hypothetical protein
MPDWSQHKNDEHDKINWNENFNKSSNIRISHLRCKITVIENVSIIF